ncbi:DUF4184 family protein [Luteibacter sp. dw_328]|uniref:DUF4184 family protein n=1 Tax=Luteibacter sp. dw_328 TaxID=2719796 RepID=UPI001BD48940|nr:DUF4184 family protein [Luteibacter sp. dw_328]
MPFTLSHVAAVLPFRRRCSVDVFAALAIGSMTPDLHYFLPLLREHWPLPSHELISLPLFCLPAGWLHPARTCCNTAAVLWVCSC